MTAAREPRHEVSGARRATESPCPRCGTLCPAELVEQDGDWYLVRRCPRCGEERVLHKRDAAFHERLRRVIDHGQATRSGSVFTPLGGAPPPATEIKIDVTERCNYTCPACFSQSSPDVQGGLPLELIRAECERLARLPNPPEISVIGGEPTLRKDLPELLEWLRGAGFAVKLNTNGHVVDRAMVDRFRAAGLRSVVLQFDGLDDRVHAVLRGHEGLTARKLELIRLLGEAGIQVVLVATVVEGLNDDHVGRMIQLGLESEHVAQVSFLPVANLGRSALGAGTSRDFDLARFLDRVGEQTGGRVTKDDFVDAARKWQTVGRWAGFVLRKRSFAASARTCLLGTFAVGRAGDYVALNRLTSPGAALRHWRKGAAAARAAGSILGWRAGRGAARGVVGIFVEKFLDAERMDYAEARNCTKYYLTPAGYVTDCVYNALVRGRPQSFHSLPPPSPPRR
ncbi:MAG: radical SAM protein [bacterium]